VSTRPLPREQLPQLTDLFAQLLSLRLEGDNLRVTDAKARAHLRQHTSAYVSIRHLRQHTSAYVSIRHLRQHTSAYVRLSRMRETICASRMRKPQLICASRVSNCTFVPVKQVNLVPAPLPPRERATLPLAPPPPHARDRRTA
jgi:hypothetical protein